MGPQTNLTSFFGVRFRGAARSGNWRINLRKKFTIPTNLAIPITSCGGGKFLMALVPPGSTEKPDEGIIWPMKRYVRSREFNFDGFDC
jgi:hypothetical protein